MRADVLRRVKPLTTATTTRTARIVAEIALHGPFHQVPELLYFRRDHPDPRRAGEPVQALPVRQPGPAPGGPAAPDAPAARRVRLGLRRRRSGGRRCPRPTGASATATWPRWMTSRVRPGAGERVEDRAPVDPAELTVSVDALVAGREGRQA